MATVSMRDLLEAGVHFGHQTRRWNPKMRPYIFTERNGIYIIDLQRTLREIRATYEFVRDITARGGSILFVGTKKQAQESIRREAARAGQPYVNHRWLGGMLTNWVTIRKRIARMTELESMRDDGSYDALPKKEVLKLEAEREKLDRNLRGIRDMTALPDAVFVVDTRRELIPVAEARKLHIPLIGLVDTNCDPDEVDFVIPGNDDAIRSVNLMCRIIADAALEGRIAAEGPQVILAEEPQIDTEIVPETPADVEIPAEETAPEEDTSPATTEDVEVRTLEETTVDEPISEKPISTEPDSEDQSPEEPTDTEPDDTLAG